MFTLIFRIIFIAVISVIAFIALSLYSGGEKFRWFGSKVKEESEKIGEKADTIKRQTDSVKQGVEKTREAIESLTGKKEKDGKSH